MFLLERLCISLSDNIFQVNSNQALLNLKVNPGWVALLDIRLHQKALRAIWRFGLSVEYKSNGLI